jgi:DNA invertase Pin-like site-specific DNA recombinase
MGIIGIYVRTSVETDGTSIEQQKKEGIKFCEKLSFDYKFYEDEGKSGFKIDEENPFKNRKGLLKLINDIENKIIDKVWVYEHSRLSRNQEASFVLFRIFKKNNITVYEKDKEFDMNDPQSQMIQGILTQISQYERHLIVNRTTRGIRDSINRGIRGYKHLYGYKNEGKKDDGHVIWVPVDSEIENIRYAYQMFLQGSSVKSIIKNIFKNVKETEYIVLIKKWTRLLKHFEYTGFSLTTDGSNIFKKYLNFEIESLTVLNQEHFVKSVNFPVQIVSFEDWITVVEKLQAHKKVYKDKMRRTNTEMLTGIIQCPYCELRYYKLVSKGYSYYKHEPKISNCGQRPKSFNIEKMDKLFELFYFYFYLVYDDTKLLIEESQRLIRLNQMELKEKIKIIESENRKLDKQIERFQSIYDNSEDQELLKLTLKKETELNLKKKSNDVILGKLRNEIDELNQKYDKDKLELTFYDVKDNVINFFEKMNSEEKRMSLMKIINNCQLFNKYLVIDTGKILFIFNIDEVNILSEEEYNKFKNDNEYKESFLKSSSLIDKNGNLSKTILDLSKGLFENYTEKDLDKYIINMLDFFAVRTLGDILIKECFLKNRNKVDVKTIMEKRLMKLSIDYKLFGIEKIVSFTHI